MRKVAVSRMRERYAQTVLTFRITYVTKSTHNFLYTGIWFLGLFCSGWRRSSLFWHCGLFPFTFMQIQLAVNCIIPQVLLYQRAAIFLYNFVLMLYWCVCFTCCALQNFLFCWPWKLIIYKDAQRSLISYCSYPQFVVKQICYLCYKWFNI